MFVIKVSSAWSSDLSGSCDLKARCIDGSLDDDLKASVSMDPSTVEAVVNWPRQMNAKEIRSFLGLVSYYRRCVQGLPSLAMSLTKLTRKNEKFMDCRV